MIQIITHRGLDPAKKNFFAESSAEAFDDQLRRGFGLEFDLRLTKDGKIAVSHDPDLKRISGGKVAEKISELTLGETASFDFDGSHLIGLEKLVRKIEQANNGSICAVHLKHDSQTKEMLDRLVEVLAGREHNFLIFDTMIETAKYLKKKNSNLATAPSVSHPFDIKRYNPSVGGTLLDMETVKKHRTLFDWVWLDEWDRQDKGGKKKNFYSKETSDELRKSGFKVGIVSPELHGTSPGLLGGEMHEDAVNFEVLQNRMKQIVQLSPDLVCTDYPDLFRALVESTKER